MKILITGLSSALGNAIAEHLSDHEVVGLDRTGHQKYRSIPCDLREGVPPLPRFDVCLHLAFITDPAICKNHSQEAHQVNITGTKDLLSCADRFVFVSTGYVYGFQDECLHEDRPAQPSDAYAEMKYEAEQIVATHGNAAVLRLFFPFGPRTKPESLVNRLIRTIGADREISCHHDGKPRTNPIHLADLVEATKRFCLGPWRGIYNVAGLEVVSIQELAEMIGAILGKRPIFRPTGQMVKNMIGSTDKLMEVFRPALTLREGLENTIAHLGFGVQEKRPERAA